MFSCAQGIVPPFSPINPPLIIGICTYLNLFLLKDTIERVLPIDNVVSCGPPVLDVGDAGNIWSSNTGKFMCAIFIFVITQVDNKCFNEEKFRPSISYRDVDMIKTLGS